jgi:GxxExxY protein
MQPQMNADERRYKHECTTRTIIGVFFDVYNELGYGFLESVYREAMAIALRAEGLTVEKEFALVARFRGHVIGAFKADLVVSGSVIVELKAVRSLDRVHEAQTLNYLRASVLEVGLLFNFGPRPQVKRLAFSNIRKSQAPLLSRPPANSVAAPPASSICVHLR